jgi:hypothetical protein
MDYAKVKFTEDDFGSLCLPERDLIDQVKHRYLSTRDVVYSNKIVLNHELSPANLYLYLLARYDLPNGVLTEVRRHDTRAQRTILWHYTLAWRKRHIHIVCYHFRIDVIFGPGPEVDVSSSEFASLVNAAFSRHKQQLGEARKKVERYRSFLNPFSHMLDAIDRLLVQAKELDESLVKTKEHPVSREDIQWHYDNHEKNSIAASKLTGCCLSVRMMAPVAAEMFVNLIIFNLFKEEGKRQNAKEDFKRESIINRVKELARNCDGFSVNPDMESAPIRDFFSLMNRRNDLLHGNIKPEDRTEDDFQVHDGVPTIMKFRPIFDRALGPTINAFPLEEALRDARVAKDFINYLLSCLDVRWKSEYELMKESIDLHYGMRSKQVRSLYGNEFHESIDPDLLDGEGPLPEWLV